MAVSRFSSVPSSFTREMIEQMARIRIRRGHDIFGCVSDYQAWAGANPKIPAVKDDIIFKVFQNILTVRYVGQSGGLNGILRKWNAFKSGQPVNVGSSKYERVRAYEASLTDRQLRMINAVKKWGARLTYKEIAKRLTRAGYHTPETGFVSLIRRYEKATGVKLPRMTKPARISRGARMAYKRRVVKFGRPRTLERHVRRP